MSYEPIHPLYGELPRFENSLFDDVSALREASRRLKAFLYSRASEIAPTEETDSAFHVLMTDRGAVVGGRDLKDLEKNALRLEQYVRKLAILSTIRRDVIKNGGPVAEMFDNLEMMERGSIYISERK